MGKNNQMKAKSKSNRNSPNSSPKILRRRNLESQGKFERLKKLNIITEREKLLSADGGI